MSLIRKGLSRRDALRLLGAGAAGGALGSRLTSSARAQSATVPKRLLLFYTQQGTLRDLWAPTGTEKDFTLGQLHGPLETHKSDLIFLHGLDMRSDEIDDVSPANAHYGGTTHALTATGRSSGTLPGGPSIDQYIAQELTARDGAATAFPSLELAAADISFGEWAVSFTGAGQPATFTVDPFTAYERVFGDYLPPDSSAADVKKAQDELVLAYAAGEFDQTTPKLSSADRLKLEAHADAIRDLQARRALVSTVTCTKPLAQDFQDASEYAARADAHFRLATAALACDRTRIVTIALPELPSSIVDYTPGQQGSTDLHDLVHKTAENGELRDDLDALAPIRKYHQYHAQQFADLLALLDAIPESDGNSLLYHSVVLWCGQLGSGSHSLDLLPWIIAGSGGGYFETGRFLQLPREGDQGLPHNDLFVSLANYMGLDIATFGDPSVCNGPLVGLRA